MNRKRTGVFGKKITNFGSNFVLKMKRILRVLAIFALLVCANEAAFAQTTVKAAAKRNLTIKEWNTDARSKTKWLDRITTYDSEGRKIEEIEYTQFGQKWRETYEYGENNKIVKEVLYDEKNRVELVRKYEYDETNRKMRQYNYAPNGKLKTIKIFEYIDGGIL